MFFLAGHTLPQEPASSTEEAGERILKLLDLALENPRQPMPSDAKPDYVKMVGYMNLAHGLSQSVLCLAYREITGQDAPEKYQVSPGSELFPKPE